jgi:hypothetical protein
MAGRLKKSLFWNYFKYDNSINKSVCLVPVVKDGKEASSSLNAFFHFLG